MKYPIIIYKRLWTQTNCTISNPYHIIWIVINLNHSHTTLWPYFCHSKYIKYSFESVLSAKTKKLYIRLLKYIPKLKSNLIYEILSILRVVHFILWISNHCFLFWSIPFCLPGAFCWTFQEPFVEHSSCNKTNDFAVFHFVLNII